MSTPNKADLVSDPYDPAFEHAIIDDDGVAWWACASELPSGFVCWQPAYDQEEVKRAIERSRTLRA